MLVYFLSVCYSQPRSMVNILGDSIGEEDQFMEGIQVVLNVIVTSAMYVYEISMKFRLFKN